MKFILYLGQFSKNNLISQSNNTKRHLLAPYVDKPKGQH